MKSAAKPESESGNETAGDTEPGMPGVGGRLPLTVASKKYPEISRGSWAVTLTVTCMFGALSWLSAVVWGNLMGAFVLGAICLYCVISLIFRVRTALEYARFGAAQLSLEAPPVIGGQLVGAISLPQAVLRVGTVKAELRCIATTRDGVDAEEPVWAEQRSFPVQACPGGGTAMLRFDIPATLGCSSAPGEHGADPEIESDYPYHRWVLRVRADVKGLEFDRTLRIRVLPPQGAAEAPARKRAPAGGDAHAGMHSTWVLVACNLVQVAGVAFWGWRVGDLVMLYWLETLIVGVVNVLRIAAATPKTPLEGYWVLKAAIITFFCIHFGLICAGWAITLGETFSIGAGFRVYADLESTIVGPIASMLPVVLRNPGLQIAALGLVASHLYSYFHDYIGRGENRGANIGRMMFQPYWRILTIFVFLMLSNLAFRFADSTVPLVIVFVICKIGIDVVLNQQKGARRLLARLERDYEES